MGSCGDGEENEAVYCDTKEEKLHPCPKSLQLFDYVSRSFHAQHFNVYRLGGLQEWVLGPSNQPTPSEELPLWEACFLGFCHSALSLGPHSVLGLNPSWVGMPGGASVTPWEPYLEAETFTRVQGLQQKHPTS